MKMQQGKTRCLEYHFGLLPEIIEFLLEKMNIAVIYSGDNRNEDAVLYRTYHARFWKTYKGVAEDIQVTLREIGFKNVSLMPDDLSLIDRLKRKDIHLAWMNTGGVQGRNSIAHAPALLEMLGVPYVGHSPLNYAVMDHKLTFKRLLRSFGIPTPRYLVWDPLRHGDRSVFLSDTGRVFGGTSGPWIVKPVTGRASRYIHFAHSTKELLAAIDRVYQLTFNPILIEAFLPGKEYCVAGGPPAIHRDGRFHKLEDPFTFSYVERYLSKGEMIFTSIDKRPIDLSRVRMLQHEEDGAIINKISEVCRFLYRKMSLKYLVRVDLRADENGCLNVLEVNPKPDLKKPIENQSSLVALGLESHGMNYRDLILGLLGHFLDLALSVRKVSAVSIHQLLEEAGVTLETTPAP